MDLQNCMHSKRSQSQEITYCTTPCLWHVQSGQIPRVRQRLSSCQGPGAAGGGGGDCQWDFSVEWWKCFQMSGVGCVNSVNTLRTTELYIFKRWTFWYMNYMAVKLPLKNKPAIKEISVKSELRAFPEVLNLQVWEGLEIDKIEWRWWWGSYPASLGPLVHWSEFLYLS